MKFSYQIFEQQNLLVERFEGEISAGDIQRLNANQQSNPSYTKVGKVISDTRNAKIKMSRDELDDFISAVKEMATITQLKWAIIDDNPINTALAMLIKNDPFLKNKVEVFSTMEAAALFLGVDYLDEFSNQAGHIHLD